MKITRILHHSVNVVGELDDSRAFYHQFLGLDPATRPFIPGVEGSWFTVADAQVHLVDAPSGTTGIQPTGPHICFGVTDLDEAMGDLDKEGIEFYCTGEGDSRQIWFNDPVGNTIEMQVDRG